MVPNIVKLLIAGLFCTAAPLAEAGSPDPSLPAYQPTHTATGTLTSVGDPAMARLMDRWLASFQQQQPRVVRGTPWRHDTDAIAISALMFETADLGALTRKPTPAELAPYGHQFAGDMMKAPLIVRVAGSAEHPAYLAVNRRPGSPLPPKVSEFVDFILSRDGQRIVEEAGGFTALSAAEAAEQRKLVSGPLASLDERLPVYRATSSVQGEIRSVGSDGMKTLMDRWMRDFMRLQPGVRHGSRWEHLGTLNGFHALLLGETDIAPMGRELWPEERAAFASAHASREPLEIRVARGGFNTPQRTTAQAIFVNERNPLKRITTGQLVDLLGDKATITRWGQLGLTGEWAKRPIDIHIPPKVAPNTMSMQIMLLQGRPWNATAQEAPIAPTAAAIAADEAALGFGGFEEGGPGLRTVPVARSDRDEAVAADVQSTSSGRYPLTRYMYIRLDREAGKPMPPQVREFLRYVLSRDAQEPILYSGYFPLTADEVREELAKLD